MRFFDGLKSKRSWKILLFFEIFLLAALLFFASRLRYHIALAGSDLLISEENAECASLMENGALAIVLSDTEENEGGRRTCRPGACQAPARRRLSCKYRLSKCYCC